jgi:outer membrane protein insertion porin family
MMRYFYFILALVVAISAVAAAEITDYLGQTITSIKLSESVGSDSFLVLNSSGLIPGEILTADKIQDAVKKIYAIGIFSNVIIKGEKSVNGVKLYIETESYPRLSSIRYAGNSKVKMKDIKKEVTITEGRIVSPGAVKNNVEAIKRLYENKGYLLATVESDITPDEKQADKVTLTFKINEGRKVKIKNIYFVDNHVFTSDKLRSKMGTKKKSFFHGGSFESDKYQEDKKKVIDFYKDQGYIDAVISEDSTWYSNDLAWMYIKLRVKEGQRYYFGKLTWQGNSVLSDNKISSAFKIKEGQTFNQEKYKNTLDKIYELYQDEGYWYTRIEEKKSPRDNYLDVDFGITEGNPAYVKMINIEGNTKTKEKVVRRELRIKPDTIFKRSILTRSLRDVMILNFFKDVQPDLAVREDNNIDLTLKIEEKETGTFSLGAGYSAQDKLVGTLGLGIPNFLGGGQTVSLDSDFGSQRTTFSLNYFEPWLLDTPTSVGISAYYQNRLNSVQLIRDNLYTTLQYTENVRGGSARVGRRLRWPDNYFQIFGGYRFEKFKLYDISPADEASKTFNNKLRGTTSVGTLSLTRDSRNLAQFATAGTYASWSGDLGGTVFGGDYNYWKQMILFEHYYTPFWKFTFAAKGKWGLLYGIRHGDNDVPFSERFTPGGTDPDGLIRGYDDSSIGQRLVSSDGKIGGRSEVIYNFEMTVPISEQQLYALLFFDAGNAYLTTHGLRHNLVGNFYKSFGFGFRVVAPMIGIIGFDFGYALDGAQKGKIKPHFQIGRGF